MDYLEWAKLALDNMDEALCSLDKEGNILVANPAYESITGYKLDDLRGKRFTSMVLESDRKSTARLIELTKESGNSIHFDCQIESKDSQPSTVSWIAKWCPEQEMVSLISTNLTDQVNQSLRCCSARVSSIMSRLVIGVIIINMDGVIETLNPSGAYSFNCEVEFLVGKHVSTVFLDGSFQDHEHTIKDLKDKAGRAICRRFGDSSEDSFHAWISVSRLKDYRGDIGHLIYMADLDHMIREVTEGKKFVRLDGESSQNI